MSSGGSKPGIFNIKYSFLNQSPTRGEHSTLYLIYLIGGLEVLTGRQHILSLKKILLQIDKLIHLAISIKSSLFSFESN